MIERCLRIAERSRYLDLIEKHFKQVGVMCSYKSIAYSTAVRLLNNAHSKKFEYDHTQLCIGGRRH
jgi:hypothetical protein